MTTRAWSGLIGASLVASLTPRPRQADGLHAVRDGIASCKAYGERHVKQLGTAWAVAKGTYRPQQKTVRSLYGNYRVGKVAEVWPPDPQPDLHCLAID